ncbi:hypothetical protein [Thalassobius sp. MITS945101]|uniref:hypothetical protein n=1 Tax=Thalassobius sp. MITS945101 TaxID=3096994 RepID=UPI00399ACC52
MTIKSVLIALPLMLLGWVATLVLVGLLSDAAPAQVVLWPGVDFTADLATDIRVIGATSWSVTLESDQPALARKLYAAGAWLVLPAGLPGCLPLPAAPA